MKNILFCAGLLSFSVAHGQQFTKASVAELPPSRVVGVGKPGTVKDPYLYLGNDSLAQILSIKGKKATTIWSDVLQGDVLQFATGDADNDGKNELFIATGRRQNDSKTPIRIYLLKEEKGVWNSQLIFEKSSPRPFVNSIHIWDQNQDGSNELMISYFESSHQVITAALTASSDGGSWSIRPISSERMAMSREIGKLAGQSNPVMVVGRPYGDSVLAVGDAYIVAGRKQLLPSWRGVKALRIGDADNDGVNDILLSDGWHQDYGKIARARLAFLRASEKGYSYELVEDVKGQFEISQIEVADIDKDKKNEVIVRGNKTVRIYRRENDGWQVATDSSLPATQFVIGDVNGDKKPDLIFADRSGTKIYNVRKLQFSSELFPEVITQVVDPASLVGKPAPELRVIQREQDSPISLAGFRGKIVLLDFWATWCKPCIKMFPTLKALHEKYHAKGLQIVGLTREDNTQTLAAIDAFTQKNPFPYLTGISEDAYNHLNYGVTGIPHLVIIDRKGIVRHFEVGNRNAEALEETIAALLSE